MTKTAAFLHYFLLHRDSENEASWSTKEKNPPICIQQEYPILPESEHQKFLTASSHFGSANPEAYH